jgi:hypothetical protein
VTLKKSIFLFCVDEAEMEQLVLLIVEVSCCDLVGVSTVVEGVEELVERE